jgi:hypothetical protein
MQELDLGFLDAAGAGAGVPAACGSLNGGAGGVAAASLRRRSMSMNGSVTGGSFCSMPLELSNELSAALLYR